MEKEKQVLPTVLQGGYGFSPKKVMLDEKLSIEAKAIYCFLASFAGNTDTAYPNVDLICGKLNISQKRFRKYKEELIEAGYVTVLRHRTENGFSNNVYKLVGYSVSTQFVSIQNVSEQNDTTNNNSSNSNSFNNNNSFTAELENKEKIHSHSDESARIHDLKNEDKKAQWTPIGEIDDDLLHYYNERYYEYFGKNHPDIRSDRVEDVLFSLHSDEYAIDEETIMDQIDLYFDELPKNNDGKIYGFLHEGVRFRLAESI